MDGGTILFADGRNPLLQFIIPFIRRAVKHHEPTEHIRFFLILRGQYPFLIPGIDHHRLIHGTAANRKTFFILLRSDLVR